MIAVVGGGISGLAVAHYLVAAGLDPVVLEAGARPGGVITTIRHDGRLFETGPQRTRLTPPVRRLVHDLGLGPRLQLAPELPLHIYADGRLRRVPTDLSELMSTDLLGWGDRLRALVEPLTAGIRPHETAAEFFIRKFGHRTYRRALAPLFGGLFASDPADMWARHALAEMLRGTGVRGSLVRALARGLRAPAAPPGCSFDGGLQTLTDALAARLGDRVRSRAPVRSLSREARGIRVVLDDEELIVDRVVLACPSAAAARMLEPMDRELSERLGRLRLNRLATVQLESAVSLGAMGYQTTLDAGLATHGVTSQHDLFGRTGLYTAFLGGPGRDRLAERPDAELAALASAEFETVTAAAAGALAVHRTAIPAWDRSWAALDGVTWPDGVDVCANWHSRAGITGRLGEALRVAGKLSAALASPGSAPGSRGRTGTPRAHARQG